MLTIRRMLGLALTARTIAVAEVGIVRGRRTLIRAAEFPFPQESLQEDPARLGKSLREFLRQNHFVASRCVMGLEAGWLMAREKLLPPASADSIGGMISITIEKDFPSGAEDLVFDFSPPIAAAQATSVLLLATSNRRLQQALTMAKAAGLAVRAVTSSTMALALATSQVATGARFVLNLSPQGVELALQSDSSFRLMRRLPVAVPVHGGEDEEARAKWQDELGMELRRVISLLPNGQGEPAAPEILIWNEAGIDVSTLASLAERLPLPVRSCGHPSDLGLARSPAGDVEGKFAAAALAIAGTSRRAPAVDFLHTRLNPGKKVPVRKITALAAVAAAIILAGVMFLLSWSGTHKELASLKDQLSGMAGAVRQAKDIVDRTSFARGWYDHRPAHMESLRELTLVFPENGRIWTTSLPMREDMRMLLTGKASDERAVLEIVDRLKASGKFSDVKPLYIRQVGTSTREVSFAASLIFAGAVQK